MRAMTLFALGLVGCGRIGYDAVGDDVVPVDADIDTPPGLLAACNVPVDLSELPVPAGKHVSAIDLGATATGFVAVWSIEDAIWATGYTVSTDHYVDLNQTGGQVTDYGTPNFAIGSNDDRAVLAVDNTGAGAIYFYPLDEAGYQRASTKSADGVHAHGNDFLIADPTELVFGVAAGNGTDVVALEREIDSHPNVEAIVAMPAIEPDTTGITRVGTGYAVISGRDAQCDVIGVGDDVMPMGSVQTISMTCHNAQIVNTTGDHVVAAWNCNDDQVWITGGSLAAGLPPHHSFFGTDGDTANSASNPRLAATSAGVWYGFQVAGGRLGRGLVDEDGSDPPRVVPEVVVNNAAGPYDLTSRGDDAYLFWTADGAANPHLWAMRLCQ